jgi:beta-ureidopropionase / N-carbamoyl-L-amino-acid hydrolase
MSTLTLEQLNAASVEQATHMLAGIYEHSPWIAQAALCARPFISIAQLRQTMIATVHTAPREQQLALIRAHPELAGKAMVAKTLTRESTQEQHSAGLTHCTPQEFETLQHLNAAYNQTFGWPFILAVRGPRGTGILRQEIITTLKRRLHSHPNVELQECLRNIHRIAEIRLADKFGQPPTRGNHVWDWAEQLAAHSDPGFAEHGQLTVTYLTAAHQACSAQLHTWMHECGFDDVHVDAVGNVVGRYRAHKPNAKTLMTGSHFDTVRNGGKYDGRLGILVPMECVRALSVAGKRLPFDLEVVGFAEEEGQRYQATFLASATLTGHFKPEWLAQKDADSVSMAQAMFAVGLPGHMEAIAQLQRDPAQYLGFVEVHIEQGPVLNELNLPLGVVTSINGSVRYVGSIQGTASHAGTTPMNRRADAAVAATELALYVEKRATQDSDSVGTVGMLHVPGGSINVVPGRCDFSLDLRASTDEQRDALARDVLAQLDAICQRRAVHYTLEKTMQAAAAPSNATWQARWEHAVAALGLPVHRMPSGAGHDAMMLHTLMPQAMLFVRGLHGGISHSPLESSTNEDIALAIAAFDQLLTQLEQELA